MPEPEHHAARGFDFARDLICTADAEGRFTTLNSSWERVLGWSREELLARPFIEFVHPEDVERTVRASARVAEVDYELTAFENRYRTKGGEWRWLRWNARSDGVSWFAVAFDVTEEKLAEEEVMTAIDEERLLAYSQPIADHRSGDVVQEELLVRMRDGNDGQVLLPAEFLPALERNGAIVAVDRWMTARGLALASGGRNVEINLSARSLASEESMDELIEAVRATGVTARRIVFEITETSALANVDGVRELAERLGRLGCRIALDDFGTGFASLTHLRELPIHVLKIDSSFVAGVKTNNADRALVRGVAAMARELGLETIAEGVEDGVTYELLRDYDIDRVQGFLIGRPAPL